MSLTITLIATLLFALTGASIAYLLVLPIVYGIVAGLSLMALVFASRIMFQSSLGATIENAALMILLIVSIAISWKALTPLLNNELVQAEKSIPLLVVTAALYVFYFLLNQTNLAEKETSVQDKLAGFFSGPPLILTAAMSVTITTYVLIAIHYVQLHHVQFANLAEKFLARGIIPPITVFLFCWGLLMIGNKVYILWDEKRSFKKKAASQSSILLQTYFQNLQSTGSTSAENYIDLLWKKSADFYILPRYINWAIPILGFIGTVLGISLAADGIQEIIGTNQNFGQLSANLGQAISPLGIAFDTTLIALSLSVLLMLLQTALQKWEDNLLIDYENRIRNMPLNAV